MSQEWIEIPSEFRSIKPEMLPTIYKMCKVISLKPLKTKGVRPCAKKLKINFKTIYSFLKAYPEPPKRPSKIQAKYVEEFEQSDTVKSFREQNRNMGHHQLERYIATCREAWKLLNKKDPMTWTEEDYLKLWKHESFIDNTTGLIGFNNACVFRKMMEHTKNYELPKRQIFRTLGLKRPKGAKKTHYLKTLDEMIRVINAIDYPDTLVMFRTGTESGARISSCLLVRPIDIDYSQEIILMREPKVSQIPERNFSKKTLDFIRRYIYDNNIKGSERLFKRGNVFYNRDLKQAGKTANIDFDLTSHVAMKHTFVSQASAHGVSLEVVSEQTGTDPSTLRDFYLGIGRAKKRHELLGEPYPIESYGEWIAKLDTYYVQRYEQIKGVRYK